MVQPSPTWNTRRVYITYRNLLTKAMEGGSWTAEANGRITNTLSDGTHQVFRKGRIAAGDLNTTEGLPSLDVDLPIVDDPDNLPQGGKITLTVTFTGGEREVFQLSPLLAWPEDGTDLALILDPTIITSAPPFAIRGVPGGVAALDADGYVLDAEDNRIMAGVDSDTFNAALSSKADEATVNAALASKADTSSLVAKADASVVATKVNKGELVFNVKDYGAVGNWAGGTSTTGTDDLSAINACFAAAASSAANAMVVFPRAVGYVVYGTVVVPDGVDVQMDAAVVYCGAGGQPALSIGSGTSGYANNNNGAARRYRLRARRPVVSDWSNEADIGVRIANRYSADITVAESENFTIGIQCIGESSKGFAYNDVRFGRIGNNKIAVDLTNTSGGWCNENVFTGGSFFCNSTTNVTLDRIGVRITSQATSKYYNNANVFYKPSFEMRGGSTAAEGLAVLVEYGTNNSFREARHEGVDGVALRNLNLSRDNLFESSFDTRGLYPIKFEDLGTYSSSVVHVGTNRIVEEATRLVHKVPNLHKSACFYDGATSVHVPGMTARTSATTLTEVRAASGIVINADYVEVSGNRSLGFYVSTRTMKRFSLIGDYETGFGGRLLISAYDSSGAVLSSTDTVRTNVVSNPIYATSFGGAFRTSADATVARHFEVSAATDRVFVGVTGGTAVCRLRSLAVYTPDAASAATWLATNDVPGENYGTAAPTAGTWAAGRRVVNAAPNGVTQAWVCTVAGTPGTWVAETVGGTFTSTPPQIDVFTTSGTWTKPNGATLVRTVVIGAGGGGGAGRRGAAGTVRCGGGAGGGGGMTQAVFDAADLTGTVAVTVGVAGTGASAVTTDDTSGGSGAAGTASSFAIYAAAAGGGGGGGGTATTGTAGAAGTASVPGGTGGSASTTGLVGNTSIPGGGAGGGGAGGGISVSNVASNGGSGTSSRSVAVATTGGTVGVVDVAGPITPNAPSSKGSPGSGGGGGASSITQAAQAGANGSGYGAGAGGGGASVNGFASGAGANGTSGYVLVITSF